MKKVTLAVLHRDETVDVRALRTVTVLHLKKLQETFDKLKNIQHALMMRRAATSMGEQADKAVNEFLHMGEVHIVGPFSMSGEEAEEAEKN